MEVLLQADGINIDYEGHEVLDIDRLTIYPFDRIGLIGANGVGKSTLMKILAGECLTKGCSVKKFGNVAYIPQLEETHAVDEMDKSLISKMALRQINEQMSGGEETRLKIARALSLQVHGIFADEPTSHLDQPGVDFLIKQLEFFDGALLIVSHDRYFLDRVVNKIWELKDGKIIEYWGNYSDYLREREKEQRRQAVEYERFVDERARLEKIVEEKRKQAQNMAKKSKNASRKRKAESGGRLAHQKSIGSKEKKMYNAAKSVERRIASLEKVDSPEKVQRIRFKQHKSLVLHNPIPIIGRDVSKSVGGRLLFEKISFQIPLGAKVALIGKNGSGKTTLLRMIMREETGISIAPNVKIGYFAQDDYKKMADQAILSYMKKDCDYSMTEIRSVLALMGFKQNELEKSVSVLSGGERTKLLLAKLLLGQYNILLMDEPSNYLDLPSFEALEEMMKAYTGTIVFVSHDKTLVNKEKAFPHNRVFDYVGTPYLFALFSDLDRKIDFCFPILGCEPVELGFGIALKRRPCPCVTVLFNPCNQGAVGIGKGRIASFVNGHRALHATNNVISLVGFLNTNKEFDVCA